MSDIALEGINVSKKFKKGELYDSLRDLIPALTSQLFRSRNGKALGQREFWALDDVSFQAYRGEALGIIGHNGAGKSTLLKILSGIMKPTKGSIKVNGRLSALIEVGAGFHQDLTGRENVFLNGAILGMSQHEIRMKFDEIVSFSGLEDFIDTPVKRYSSGMYARLGFSVAAHIHPEILLVDEVLSVGDWSFQKKCANKMKQLIKSGVSVVFISHNLRAVTDLCNKCFLLDHGKIAKTGSPDEVVKFYLDSISQILMEPQKSQVYVSKVTVLKDGIEESQFKTGDKIVVKINVDSEIDCHDMALHVYLKDNRDYQFFYAYLDLLGLGGFSLKEGESKEFNLELSMHLATGVYYLGVSIVNRNDTMNVYDNKYPAAKLYIESSEALRSVTNLYPKLLP